MALLPGNFPVGPDPCPPPPHSHTHCTHTLTPNRRVDRSLSGLLLPQLGISPPPRLCILSTLLSSPYRSWQTAGVTGHGADKPSLAQVLASKPLQRPQSSPGDPQDQCGKYWVVIRSLDSTPKSNDFHKHYANAVLRWEKHLPYPFSQSLGPSQLDPGGTMGSRPRWRGISDQSSLPTAPPSISDNLKVTSSRTRDRPRLEEN